MRKFLYFVTFGFLGIIIGYIINKPYNVILPKLNEELKKSEELAMEEGAKKRQYKIYYSKNLYIDKFYDEEKYKPKVPIPSLSEVLFGKSVEALNKYRLLGISNENGYKAILQDGSGKILKVKRNDILPDNITVADIDNKSVLLKIIVDNKTSERRIKIYDITFKEWK